LVGIENRSKPVPGRAASQYVVVVEKVGIPATVAGAVEKSTE
jgi:hypothetical protein